MSRHGSYHMRDQVRNRVRLIMHDDERPGILATLWPLALVMGTALTLLNVLLGGHPA